MKRFHTSVSISVALIMLLLALFSSNVEGRQMAPASMDLASGKTVRDLQVNKEMKEVPVGGEKDSLRRIPGSNSSPIQNRKGPLTYTGGSKKQKITAKEP